MHLGTLAERQRLADETSESLSDLVVHPLHHAGFAAAFITGAMLPARECGNVSLVKVRVNQLAAVALRNTLPQQTAGFGTSVADRVGDNLTGLPGDNQPNPFLVLFLSNETPHLVCFKAVSFLCGQNRRLKGWKLADFFPAATWQR